jgi:hypothetical protein
MKRALSAVHRMDIDRSHPDYFAESYRLYVWMSEAYAEDPCCRMCDAKVTATRTPAPYGPHTGLPTMVSLDAIRPRGDRGSYWNDNIQLVDVGCNCVKLKFDLEEAMVLIGRLGGQRDLHVDDDGMLCPPKEPRVDHATMKTVVVEAGPASAARAAVDCLLR